MSWDQKNQPDFMDPVEIPKPAQPRSPSHALSLQRDFSYVETLWHPLRRFPTEPTVLDFHHLQIILDRKPSCPSQGIELSKNMENAQGRMFSTPRKIPPIRKTKLDQPTLHLLVLCR